MVQNHEVKKIRSIYITFIIFLMMVVLSFSFIYIYSTSTLQESLTSVAISQMEHSTLLIGNKVKEIEIEADGILHSGNLKNLQLALTEGTDVYDFVSAARTMKGYLNDRQSSNVGMAFFVLYWPRSGRIISNVAGAGISSGLFDDLEDNKWVIYGNEIYYFRKYTTSWDKNDDEPYLIIKMDGDYLYKIKNMTVNLGNGGTMLLYGDYNSIFSTSEKEKTLLSELSHQKLDIQYYIIKIDDQDYRVVKSKESANGLYLISYYPINEMNKPINSITWIIGISLLAVLIVGTFIMLQYYRHILLQLNMMTEKLKQLESGDLTVQIDKDKLPDNEFSYVFKQFNSMVNKIRELLASSIKEQQLRNQAEVRQLQLQINPHFLYNSLSYIVTVADKPKAVTEMAAHLANYYRYCTKNKTRATIGEEIGYAKSYLSIIAMRKNIEYYLDVPESLYNVRIIPLILQPLIENAIEHGIEEREYAKHIQVKMYMMGTGEIRTEVSDDGHGLSDEAIEKLEKQISKKTRDAEESVGLWNVNQRLINYYDETARLQFTKSQWGGLRVYFIFRPEDGNDTTYSG